MTFVKQAGSVHPCFQVRALHLVVLQELAYHCRRFTAVHVKLSPSAKSFRSSQEFPSEM